MVHVKNLKKIAYTFGSYTKAQEIIYLLSDLKKCVRHGFYPSEIAQIARFCQKNNLSLIKSPYKILSLENKTYSNKAKRVPENNLEGMYFCYIAKDELITWQACYAELMQDHTTLGQILSYPKCCINFFNKNWSEENSNPQHSPTNPLTNITKRDQDITLITHFPCHSDCKYSIKLAEEYLQTIKKIDEEKAVEIIKKLTD